MAYLISFEKIEGVCEAKRMMMRSGWEESIVNLFDI